MPGWGSVLTEIGKKQTEGRQAVDHIRRRYLKKLHQHTSRNVIAYYSGWLHRPPGTPNIQLGDDDMNAFMAAVHQLDRSQGLDLLLHTPGGDIAATEALVQYLWQMFDKDIRVIVPQLSMSAGTMMACASKCIVMGKQSSLGPIDPQIMGMPAQAILEEFELGIETIRKDPASTPLWQQIVARYHPSFLVECVQAIRWSRTMVKEWLLGNMLAHTENAETCADKIVGYLSDHKTTATHARHIPASICRDVGLCVERLEDDKKLQDLVLTVHHAYMHTFSMSPSIKITENHNGVATILSGAIVPGQGLKGTAPGDDASSVSPPPPLEMSNIPAKDSAPI